MLTNRPFAQNKEITIRDVVINVYLGYTELERSFTQKGLLDIKFSLKSNESCQDNLNNLLCYDELIGQVNSLLLNKPFKTVEYLAEEVYFFLKGCYKSIQDLEIKVKKLNPPLSSGAEVGLIEVKMGVYNG